MYKMASRAEVCSITALWFVDKSPQLCLRLVLLIWQGRHPVRGVQHLLLLLLFLQDSKGVGRNWGWSTIELQVPHFLMALFPCRPAACVLLFSFLCSEEKSLVVHKGQTSGKRNHVVVIVFIWGTCTPCFPGYKPCPCQTSAANPFRLLWCLSHS